jgi:hypothetical protein
MTLTQNEAGCCGWKCAVHTEQIRSMGQFVGDIVREVEALDKFEG